MALYLVMGFGIAAAVAVFYYFYYRRMLLFFCKKEQSHRIHIISIVLGIVTGVLSLNLFGTAALVFLHIAAAQALFGLVFLLARKIKKDRLAADALFCKVFYSGMVPLVITGVILLCGYFRMHDIHVREYEITTEKALLRDYTAAMISDLHFGETMDVEKLRRYCVEISEKHPDFVILCGDIVDESTTKEEMHEGIQALGEIKSTYGTFYVFGNHDSAQYAFHPPFTRQELVTALKENGITVLMDETVELGEDFLLAGRNDRSMSGGARLQTAQLLDGADTGRFILLLDHQPVELAQNAAEGVDLQLSGHTHGGQIWPVGLLIDFCGFGEMSYGYRRIGQYQVIVSSGMAGWGYPIRTGSRSEYLWITFHAAKKAGEE